MKASIKQELPDHDKEYQIVICMVLFGLVIGILTFLLDSWVFILVGSACLVGYYVGCRVQRWVHGVRGNPVPHGDFIDMRPENWEKKLEWPLLSLKFWKGTYYALVIWPDGVKYFSVPVADAYFVYVAEDAEEFVEPLVPNGYPQVHFHIRESTRKRYESPFGDLNPSAVHARWVENVGGSIANLMRN